jgi:hypothetical protein
MFIATTLLISTPIVQSPRQPSTAESAHIFRISEAFRRATSDHLRANFSDQPKQKTAARHGGVFVSMRRGLPASSSICGMDEALF